MPVLHSKAPAPVSLPPQSRTRRFIKYWIPVIICANIIFYFSSIPGECITPVFQYQDVVLHLLEYCALAVLLSRALKEYFPRVVLKKRYALVFIICALFALSDEFHQFFVPGRCAAFVDFLSDCAGILCAGIYCIWQR